MKVATTAIKTPSALIARCVMTLFMVITLFASCRHPSDSVRDGSGQKGSTLRFLIESSPNNLDLRQGTDAQSERIGALIYDPLMRKDEHFHLQPWLATSWERPDPLTWIFHLRGGVRFHDGHPLTSADVAYTLRSMVDGTLVTAKGGAFKSIASIETPDPLTLVLRTTIADASLLFNLSDGLFGVVEAGASADEGLHPVGSGPFRFVSQAQDRNVIVERNPNYWAGAPNVARVEFAVVPDTISTALEMKKGSGDVESNVLTIDMVHALGGLPQVRMETGPGARVDYLNFNVSDPALRDRRVRQAIACAIDRPSLVAALWLGQARLANTLLPTGHWAAIDDAALPHYEHDVARAERLLDAAGLRPDTHGVRLRLTLKTSTDETTRLEAQAMQAELHEAGIELSLRSAEFGTFYADITRGAFQLYLLRWIGSNQDPYIFYYAYAAAMAPPKGANRGRYANAAFDKLLAQATAEPDEGKRRAIYAEVQRILAEDLPSLPLWYPNNVVLHSPRLQGVTMNAGGSFDFLRTATLR